MADSFLPMTAARDGYLASTKRHMLLLDRNRHCLSTQSYSDSGRSIDQKPERYVIIEPHKVKHRVVVSQERE